MSSTRLPLPLVAPAQPVRVLLSEPMLRYRCNQKGCCCRGWDIPFKLDDFIRLFEHLPEGEREELGRGLNLIVDEAPPEARADMLLRSLKLAGVGEDRRCRFCESDGGCRVHARHGISALPDICVNFPAQGFRDAESGIVELYWDPICPEVVRLFAEQPGPLAMGAIEAAPAGAPAAAQRIARDVSSAPERDAASTPMLPTEMGWHDPGFVQRVANAREPVRARVDGVALSRAELEHVRRETLRALGDRARPTWEQLAAVLHGFRALEPGGALAFAARPSGDLDAFQRYLGGCIGAHGAPLLFWSLRKMERFVFSLELGPLIAEPPALLAGLEGWGDALDAWYFPREEALRPIFSRYLQHRFAMLYINQEGELREAADTIALLFGAALRYAGGLAAALARPVDDAIAQAGISAAEYLYRSVQFSSDTLPWFASAEDRIASRGAPLKEDS